MISLHSSGIGVPLSSRNPRSKLAFAICVFLQDERRFRLYSAQQLMQLLSGRNLVPRLRYFGRKMSAELHA